MTTKWLSRQGDPIKGSLHAANQQKKLSQNLTIHYFPWMEPKASPK